MEFPLIGTHNTGLRLVVHNPEIGSAFQRYTNFKISTFDYQAGLGGRAGAPAINWGTIAGLAIIVGIGASFWTAVGLFVAYLCR